MEHTVTGVEHTRFGELHALLKLAKQLRAGAADTTDYTYTHLFLRTACALEARADRLAFPMYRTGHAMRGGAQLH